MMIEAAVPTRRREVLAIDMYTVLRQFWASVNPSEEKNKKFLPIWAQVCLMRVRGIAI
jgi:hypothetical protein